MAAPSARSFLLFGVAATMLGTATVIGAAYLVSVVVTAVFLEDQGIAAVAGPLALVAGLALARAPLLWGGDALVQAAADRTKGRLRADLTSHLFALGPAYTGRERTGELTSVLIDGMEAIDAYVTSFQPARWLAFVVPLLVLGIVLVLDPPSALVLVVTGPVLILLLAMIGGRTGAVARRRFAELRWLSAYFLDMLQGIATLKAFGRSAEQVDNLRAISRQYGETTLEVLRTAFQTALVLEWGGAIAVALVAVEVSLRLVDGSIPFDRALAVLIIVPEFFLPLRHLAIRYHAGGEGRTAADRIFAILDTPLPRHRPAGTGPAPAAGAATDIRFADVTFTYPGRAVPALRNVELTIRGGRATALVGETGAGKTTIANLLLRFVEPDSGTILVGDTALTAIDPSAWRAHVAWVPQRPHAFHGSVADNIRLARPDATDAAVRRAATDAGADEFIDALPRGYDTQVGEGGARLSGGQRQRLAIARAFLADAQLVILDEVTSQLDATSEARIRDAIERLSRGRTVLVISHRLRLLSMVDGVVVLAGGRIVESGAPDELAARDGPYRRLVATLGAEEADA